MFINILSFASSNSQSTISNTLNHFHTLRNLKSSNFQIFSSILFGF